MEALETQAQATQEKENAVTKQNMKYTMSSSRGIYLSWLTGRIYSTILADHEKLTIDIRPVKKIVHKRGENYGSNTYELQNTGILYIFHLSGSDFLFFQSWNDCICFSVYMGRL